MGRGAANQQSQCCEFHWIFVVAGLPNRAGEDGIGAIGGRSAGAGRDLRRLAHQNLLLHLLSYSCMGLGLGGNWRLSQLFAQTQRLQQLCQTQLCSI